MEDRSTNDGGRNNEHRVWSWWYLLLAIPFVGLLIPQFYAYENPRLFGWPFFYWYQFAWLFITSGLVTTVYRVTR